ncbi:Transcriptional regulatory protein SrrA [Corynebacterium guangdongense]|nr:Transcriptional regulatory protein SrrA [Corynebacterium guangdongense]
MDTVSRTILVVDDEAAIRRVLRQYLEADHHRVLEADTGRAALRLLEQEHVDLVLLDIGLPDIDGFQVLSTLRRTLSTYVMVVSARTEETDKLVGLNVGADDYVTKPFSVREVAARINAVFRRMDNAREGTDDVLRFGALTITPEAREVRLDDSPVELSALDFDLLLALASRPGRVWSRQQLLEHVWGYDFYGDDRVVDVHIRTIRRALGEDADAPRFIATVRGAGYKFVGRP